MTRFGPALRLPRFTLWLAFVAALAHVGLGFASAQHHAYMLASGSGAWTEVCTPFGIERVSLFDAAESDGAGDSPAAAAQMAECLVCAAASFGAPPPSVLPQSLPPLAYLTSVSASSTGESGTGFLTLHPAPRAPPLLS
ncbi:MAG TPA: hypothetical protein PK725_01915 [Rhodocyclaceae bacterium]|jgi:hypothetical protein|nr:hypothetical protein [Rhodocyclaceae bacterium]HRQ45673.1 hypothetical protein [Rhodocyclaceae bacterium]